MVKEEIQKKVGWWLSAETGYPPYKIPVNKAVNGIFCPRCREIIRLFIKASNNDWVLPDYELNYLLNMLENLGFDTTKYYEIPK